MSKTDTPIKYIVKEKSLIGNEIFEPGAEVTLPTGTLPAENLEPTCDRGRQAHQEYLESNAARVAKMKEDFGSDPGSNEVLAKLIGAAVATALKEQKAADAAAAEKATKAAEKKPAKAKPDAPGPAADKPEGEGDKPAGADTGAGGDLA